MIPITIDITSVVQYFSFSKEQVESFTSLLLNNIRISYMQQWEKNADTLSKSRQAYKSGMNWVYPDSNSVLFTMEGKGESKLGLMIEAGASPFDIKEGFEKSSKRTEKKDGGWYLTIPFRVATAEAIGESSVFGGKMTNEVQKLIKKEKVLTLKNVPKELQHYGIRKEISTPEKVYPEYKHKSFQFEGLRKSEKSKHGKYEMFRRVSDNSDDNSWIHPGFQPRNFMEKTMQDIQLDKIVTQTKQQYLSDL